MRLYIVEMHDGRRWTPTVGVALDRATARVVLRHWRERNRGGEFRLTRYTHLRVVR